MDFSARTKGRKYGFACLICRRRKVKCDGRRPTCVNCARSKETCCYKERPVFATRLSEELQAGRVRIQELENHIRDLAALDSAGRDLRLAELVSQLGSHQPEQELTNNEQTTSTPDLPFAVGDTEGQSAADDVSSDGGAQFSVDTEGKQRFYGATSRFHAISEHGDPLNERIDSTETEVREMESYHQKWLFSNARFQPSWERMARANMSQYTDIDSTICCSLLDVYWSWQAPLHNCIYRRCFFRDMALGGPYFSRFLLNVIFAHACRHMPEDDARFAPFERGETFLREAMLLLIDEMKQSKPQIPTIQGLLILGGRQCAVGKSSEGWLYTGMAIRMITDLGLHIKRSKASLMKEYEPDDLEVRKRLYLSVYAWDKSISLCLGRQPSLKEMPSSLSSILDLSDDGDLWQPPNLLETDRVYPETACHSTLTFIHFCNLAQITNETYNILYSGPVRNIDPDVIFELEKKLVRFHGNLPSSLRIEDAADLQFCVPPHILCLNVLYRTILILLFRPFFIWLWHAELRHHPLALRAVNVCMEQAAGVNELFRAYGRLFNFQYQSYLVSYCVYTAATIDVRLVRHDDKALAGMAADRLAITLRMLETEVKQTPGIRRSIEIIRSHIGQQWASDSHAQTGRPSEVTDTSLLNRPNQAGFPLEPIPNTLHHQTASPPQTVKDTSLCGPSTTSVPAEASQLHFSEGLRFTVDPVLQLEPAWVDWNFDDSGGGFVPDMAYWSHFGQTY